MVTEAPLLRTTRSERSSGGTRSAMRAGLQVLRTAVATGGCRASLSVHFARGPVGGGGPSRPVPSV
jgi:hypothetical protein